ncbi:MAG: hypothetical protein HWE27_00465 [Gammaproteobacteria bacterium]|nr:hypothetical protein [Gammaproteobacteria bacterium]
MTIFLKLKSWQVFCILVLMPATLQIILMPKVEPGMPIPLNVFQTTFPILMIVFITCFMSWFWSIGTGINKLINVDIRPKVSKFELSIYYSVSYMFVVTLLIAFVLDLSQPTGYESLIIPFHLLAMFSVFYCVYFIAKNLAMAEKNERLTFTDFAGTFFLIWFYPVGIWFVQPRVNKLVKHNS